jgi:hypothetical protein
MVSVLEPIARYQNNKPFAVWVQDFEDFVLANFGDNIPQNRKRAILMQLIGPEAKKYAESLDPDTRGDYNRVLGALKDKFHHQANETIERHIFNTMIQGDNEPIDSFILRLKEQSQKCNYKVPSEAQTVRVAEADHEIERTYVDISDSLIRDRVVVGVVNQATKTRLLREHQLTLDTAIHIVKSQELADERVQTLQDAQAVNAIKRKFNQNSYRHNDMKPQYNSDRNRDSFKTRDENQNSNIPKTFRPCRFCGIKHKFGQRSMCPAFGETCEKCGKLNHYSKVCRSVNAIGSDTPTNSDEYAMYEQECDEGDMVLNIGALTVSPVSKVQDSTIVNTCNKFKLKEWTEFVNIENTKIQCKVDSGAECDVMSKAVLDQLKVDSKIIPCKTVLKAYGGTELPLLGTCRLKCILGKDEIMTDFFIVPFKARTVLGLDSNFSTPHVQ